MFRSSVVIQVKLITPHYCLPSSKICLIDLVFFLVFFHSLSLSHPLINTLLNSFSFSFTFAVVVFVVQSIKSWWNYSKILIKIVFSFDHQPLILLTISTECWWKNGRWSFENFVQTSHMSLACVLLFRFCFSCKIVVIDRKSRCFLSFSFFY